MSADVDALVAFICDNKPMRAMVAVLLVNVRSMWARIFGGDTGGLTTRCNGCSDSSPHDGHLALGALTYLGRKSHP